MFSGIRYHSQKTSLCKKSSVDVTDVYKFLTDVSL